MDYESKNTFGRPDKCTKKICDAILYNVSRRVPRILAAEAQGITSNTFHNWIKTGQEDCENGSNTKYADFFRRLRQVEQELIITHVDRISSAEVGWQANAWITERLFWKYYGQNAPLIELEERIKKMESQVNSDDK